MKKIDFNQFLKEIIEQLNKGAFLTVRNKTGITNTMTISWGMFGFMWFKPVFMVMVRKSRYTFNIIENSNTFSVSFPIKKPLIEALQICGTKSGKDINKFQASNITVTDLQEYKTPIISECDLHLECKIIHKQPIDPASLNDEINKVYGAAKDYHVLYYGEILSCYANEDIL